MKRQTKIMAILNTTSDSLYIEAEADLEVLIGQMLNEGADIIDVGGESTGPGSLDVEADEEWKRIEPALKVLKELRSSGLEFEISIDTYKADVFEKALKYEIDMLNDVTALRGDKRMVKLIANSGVKVCLMYAAVSLSAGGNKVRTNNDDVQYDDVIQTIGDFLEERINYAFENGVKAEQIIIDPGMGSFISGNPNYTFEVLDRLWELKKRFPNYPLLIGASRKGFTGLVQGSSKKLPVEERLKGSLAAASVAVNNGADILRVHDIAPTKDMLKIFT